MICAVTRDRRLHRHLDIGDDEVSNVREVMLQTLQHLASEGLGLVILISRYRGGVFGSLTPKCRLQPLHYNTCVYKQRQSEQEREQNMVGSNRCREPSLVQGIRDERGLRLRSFVLTRRASTAPGCGCGCWVKIGCVCVCVCACVRALL